MQAPLGVHFLGGLVWLVQLITTNILFAPDFTGQLLGLDQVVLLLVLPVISRNWLAGWEGRSLACVFASCGLTLKQASLGFFFP